MITARFFSTFFSLKMLSKHAALPIMLWHQNTWNSEQAPLLSGGWHGGRKKEKRKKWPTWSCASSASLFCFFPAHFFLTHFSNSGFGNCEQVSSPPLFAFVCPHRLCLPQVLKKILNVKQVFINLLVWKGSSLFVAQNYKCLKLINQL